jgi:hypothetical protein
MLNILQLADALHVTAKELFDENIDNQEYLK